LGWACGDNASSSVQDHIFQRWPQQAQIRTEARLI